MSSIGTKSPRGSTRRNRRQIRRLQSQGRPMRVALAISSPTDLLPGVLALDMLEKEFSGRWRALEIFGDGFRHGEIPVDACGLEFNLERFRRCIITDGSDVARTNRLTLDLSHGNQSARKSTFAVSSGVRKWSGLSICTLICRVPFERFASGAISATYQGQV